MRTLLAHQPLVLLFLTIGLGFLLSKVQVRGVTLGVASVLFVGLALGAWGGHPFELPEILSQLGLLLFIYALGLQAGPGYARMLRRRGLGLTLLAVLAVGAAALVALVAATLGGISPATAVGLFAGGTFNVPSLAAVNELVRGTPAALAPTIGYSLASPWGVAVPILVAELAARLTRVDVPRAAQEAEAEASELPPSPIACNVRVEAAELEGQPLGSSELAALPVRISRVERAGRQEVATPETVLRRGDVVHLVGTEEGVRAARGLLGPEVPGPGPEARRDEVDFRRVLLSNPELAGRRLAELAFEARWGAVVTRVRRGDHDFVPGPDTVLERGDRLRVVAPPTRLDDIARYLGDSYRAVSETDYLSLSLGVVMGLLVGAIQLPLPGHLTLQLGLAGGPLVVALVLGYLGRTGPIIWTLPPSANLALRQLGLVLFFAVVGLKAGSYLGAALANQGLLLFLVGGAVALAACGVLMVGAMAWLKLDWVTATGLLAGGQTQPALLTYIGERSRSEAPAIAYAAIMPTAMIAKILLAQLLFWLLGS